MRNSKTILIPAAAALAALAVILFTRQSAVGEDYVSLRFNNVSYYGGANPDSCCDGITLNCETGELVTVSQITGISDTELLQEISSAMGLSGTAGWDDLDFYLTDTEIVFFYRVPKIKRGCCSIDESSIEQQPHFLFLFLISFICAVCTAAHFYPTTISSAVSIALSTISSIFSASFSSERLITLMFGFVTGCFATKIVQQSSKG